MVKFKEERKLSEEICKSMETVELSHNYNQNSPENKVELHLYAIVLSYCLERDYDLDFPSICNSSLELVLLISKIKVNSMAIVRMKSIDGYEEFQKSSMFPGIDNAFTSSVKQDKLALNITTEQGKTLKDVIRQLHMLWMRGLS